ncbi:MAG: ankyrin repeat domain-containing protein, partial [Candidatus Paceibacterota bacterium]
QTIKMNIFAQIPIYDRLTYYLQQKDYCSLILTSNDIYSLTKKNVSYRAKMFNNSIKLACKYGDLEVIKWIYYNIISKNDKYPEPFEKRASMECAIINGHLEVVKWLYLHGKHIIYSAAITDAARNGHIEMLEWLTDNSDCGLIDFQTIVSKGYLEIIKLLHKKNRLPRLSKYAMNWEIDWAAGNGHLHVVKWLHEYRSEGCSYRAMNMAAKNGHIKVVKWLDSNRNEGCTKDAVDYAAANGHFEIVKWLLNNRKEGCKFAMKFSIKYGHLKIVKYLHTKHQQGFSEDDIKWAVTNNHYKVLKYLNQIKNKQKNEDKWTNE